MFMDEKEKTTDHPMPHHNIKDVRNMLSKSFGIVPKDEQKYITALTHESAEHSEGNERLAFIGDAILRLVIGEYYYTEDERANTGTLTDRKKGVESDERLAKVAESLHLREYMRFGNTYSKRQEDTDLDSIKATALEAVIGAIYMDHSFKIAKEASLKVLADIL
jgi:ribonuclease-3